MASSNVARGGRANRVIRHLGNLLIVVGLVLLVATAGIWGYSQYLGWQAEQERLDFIRTFPTSAPTVAPPAAATAPVTLRSPEAAVPTTTEAESTAPGLMQPTVPAATDPAAGGAETAEPIAENPVVAEPEVPPAPAWQTAPPPLRITVPKIDLDTKVMVSEIQDGAWEVPKFVAGYLDGTGRPTKEGGNVALSGHIQSLTSGNVFARIGELEWGDSITLYTDQGRFEYEVTEKRIVKPDNVEVTFPTENPTVTLITCVGDWDPIARDYTQRLIIFGKLIAVNGEPVT